jgi:hypothetical protein
MILQMVFEKIAKATYARAGNRIPPRTHQVAASLFQHLKRHPAGKQLLTSNGNAESFVMQLEIAPRPP